MSEAEIKLHIENNDLKIMIFQMQIQIAQRDKEKFMAMLPQVETSTQAAATPVVQ
jgi:hypothetical protein